MAVALVDAQRSGALQIAGCSAKQVSVGPDAADAVDGSARQRDGERYGVAVGDRLGCALAIALLVAVFFQVGRPDDRAGHAHLAVLARNGCSVARAGDREFLETRALVRFRCEQRIVDGISGDRADDLAKRPEHAPESGKDDGGHGLFLCGGDAPMMEDGPAGQAGLDDDAVQPGMRVDVAVLAKSDEKVVLRWTGADEQYVAAQDISGHRRESSRQNLCQVTGNVAVAQRVAGRCDALGARSLERTGCQSDAVETCFGIAAMEAEGRTLKLLRMVREAHREVGHRGCGYWASKSLPGRCGSPWKFIAFLKREAQVAIVFSQP